jgi:MFS transporter, DHA1 family, solute carrier family 18 (vesicular amine transporter), member 1/2
MIKLRAWRGSPTAALLVVTVAIFTDMFLYGLVVPILPGYAAAMGVSEWEVGVLFGSYALAVLAATPLFGAVSDRVGRRGPMVWGLLGLGAATVLFAFATDYLGLLAARVVQGIAAAATWTAGLALVADLFPARTRGTAMGIALSGMTAGLLVGPPVGGLLFEWGGYRLPFLLAAALAVLDGLARALLLADPPRRSDVPLPLSELLRDPLVLIASGVVVISAGSWGLLEPVLPLYLERRFEASPSTIGLLFGAATLAYGISSPLIGALVDRCGGRRTMAAGLVALALALPLVGWANGVLLAGCALLVVSVAYGFALTPTLPVLAEAVDRRGGGGYGGVYAIYNVAYAVGMMAGPILGGVLASAVGIAPTLLIAGLVVLSYVPVLLVGRRDYR